VLHSVRGLLLVAALGAAAQAQAQTAAQKELNDLTGAPAGTRCFQSVRLAQEFATAREVVSDPEMIERVRGFGKKN